MNIRVGNGFDGGTLEDCLHFTEAVRSVAGALGCALSPLRTRQAVVPLSSPGVQFSFVCEGSAPGQIHAIAELDRVVEPGVLPVELRAHPFIQVPVESQRHLGGAPTVKVGVGQLRRPRREVRRWLRYFRGRMLIVYALNLRLI